MIISLLMKIEYISKVAGDHFSLRNSLSFAYAATTNITGFQLLAISAEVVFIEFRIFTSDNKALQYKFRYAAVHNKAPRHVVCAQLFAIYLNATI